MFTTERRHRRQIALILLVTSGLVGVLWACVPAITTPEAKSKPSINLQDCQLSAKGVSQRLEAKCGALTVYENRAAQSGRQIQLHLAVLPAVSRKSLPDPLFFIPGGPGEAATESYLAVSAAFDRINQKRDIVLVDQRGTGQSNPLRCPASSKTDSEDPSQVKAALQACLASLDADARFYTTAIAMEDLNQVRQALGYDKINLYGGSYGTRAVMAYMRQFPGSVRTAILDGVAPPNWPLGPDSAQNAQRALDRIFARCAADPACNQNFSDLPEKFQSILQELDQKPVTIKINDPVTGELRDFTVTSEFIAGTVLNMSYEAESVALLPLLINTATTRGDLSLLASQGLSNSEQLGDKISDGMRYSILCSEDVPFYPASMNLSGYLKDSFTKGIQEICAAWPRGELPADYKNPVRSEAPALIISGEDDPVTPPANGELAAQGLPNSLPLVVRGMGHINIFRGCLPRLASDFIDQGTTKGLDTGCVQQIRPFPFFTSFSGPGP